MEGVVKTLERQIGQYVEVSQRKEPGRLPSQSEQAKAATVLRSGKVLSNPTPAELSDIPVNVSADREVPSKNDLDTQIGIGTSKGPEIGHRDTSRIHKSPNPYVPPIPFPGRLQKSKLDQAFREIYDILSKVNVSLPLLEVIEKMPAYAKFFKEINSKTRKKEFLEKIVISKEASAAMETALPPKLKDPGSFIIAISVGETRKEKAMLDLGASINLMPYALFKDLGLEGLKPTTMELILADRSVHHPTGVVEDVLVRVGELIILADFVILEMESDSSKAR